MKRLSWRFLSAVVLCVASRAAHAQTDASPACSLPAPSFTTTAPDIFNDRQEQDLGDALAELTESDMKIAPPAAGDELTRVGEKLLAALPPTGLQYRFRIYDSGEVNGFSLAGGRVYISRKLVAAVKNEDELAGVLAHEIGHISTHQVAIEMTRLLRIRLGITQVGDRADIFAKIHKLWSTPAKDNELEENEEKNQFIADRVALYALIRAGYAPESFASFMNESMMNKGKTGNWVTDMFGITHEESQRYRRALKLISELPPNCNGKKPASSDIFLTWQRNTVEERVKSAQSTASGDQPITLDPPLRPSPWRIRFSQDGKYLLAQDDGSITIVDRAAAKVLFQIDAPDAEQAQFSPDSQSVVFHDAQLRVEKWDLATGHRAGVKELVVYDGCTQTLLSPDGSALACVKFEMGEISYKVGLRLIDVNTGVPFYDKPNFFEPGSFGNEYLNLALALYAITSHKIASMHVTPDGHYLLVIVGQQKLAYDLQTRREIALGGKLKGLTESRMCFVGSDELFVVSDQKNGSLLRGYLYSFPEGKQLRELDIGDQSIEGVSRGQALLAWPLENFAIGVVDLNQSKIVAASKLSAMDQWDNWLASEHPMGGLQLSQAGPSQPTAHIVLPLGPLPGVRSAAFSPDGKFLALSLRNRSAVWNLETGKQVRLMRPFRTAWIDAGGRFWGEFPKYGQRDAEILAMSLDVDDSKDLGKYEDNEWQYRDLEYSFKSMGSGKNVNTHATLQVKRMGTQQVAWSHDYPHETPACWPAEDNRFVLGWDLSTEGAKDEIKLHPQLKAAADALKDHHKGLLLETVVPETGAPLEQLVVPEVDLSRGWNDERFARVSGESVLVRGEHGNTVIYRLDTGVKVGEFFGFPAATDAASGLIAAVNRDDEILLVDERTGRELNRFTVGAPVRLARIVDGKTLLVLTADQVVHRLPLGNDAGQQSLTTAKTTN